jgi:hypothetical protein
LGHQTVWCCTGQVLFTIRCAFCGCSDSARSVRALWHFCRCPLQSTVALESLLRGHTGQSGGPPDSPMNYSGAALHKPEGEEFELIAPGAPDTVRWHTGQSGAPNQGSLRFYFAPFLSNPNFDIFIGLC